MKHNKKLLILILLVLSCLALAVTGSVAAYNKTNFVKRVVTTKSDSHELRFSSNYLSHMRQGDSYPQKVIRISGAGLSVGVTVCNYPQSDITKFSNSEIKFKLKVELRAPDGKTVTDKGTQSKITISTTSLDKFDSEKEYSLPGGKSSMKLFNFVCTDASNLKDYSLRIDAIPTDTGMDKLGADLKLTSGEAMETAWTGEFSHDNNDDPRKLDAFNYVISGSAEGTVTLTVSDKIKISDFSFKELKATQTGNDISFQVGGEGKPTSYRLQFYRTGAIPNTEAWSTVEGDGGYIKFNFTPKSSE